MRPGSTLVQLAPTLILIVACFLLGEIALSPASPGANANASGVAAVTRGRSGSSTMIRSRTCGSRSRSAAAARRRCRGCARSSAATARTSTSEATRFVSFESVGRGEPRFATSAGSRGQPAARSRIWPSSAPPSRSPTKAGTTRTTPSRSETGARAPPRSPAPTATRRSRSPAARAASRCRSGHHTPADRPSTSIPRRSQRAAGFAVEAIRLLDRDLGRSEGTKPAAAEPAASSAG